METRANYVMVGAFAVAILGAAMLFALWLVRADFNQSFVSYEVVFKGPVRGLAKAGEVRFNGIKVGDVTTLKIDPDNTNRVLAQIRIDSATPVRRSTMARLEPVGLTGVTLIQLTPGDPKDPLLKPRFGAPPPQILAAPGPLDSIVAAGQSVAERVNDTLDKVQTILTKENVDRISRTLDHLEKASASLNGRDGLLTKANAAAASLDKGGKDISLAAASITKVSEDAHLELTSGDAHRAIVSAADAADIAAHETLPDISIAAADLRRLSASLAELSNQVQTNPLVARAPKQTIRLAP